MYFVVLCGGVIYFKGYIDMKFFEDYLLKIMLVFFFVVVLVFVYGFIVWIVWVFLIKLRFLFKYEIEGFL